MKARNFLLQPWHDVKPPSLLLVAWGVIYDSPVMDFLTAIQIRVNVDTLLFIDVVIECGYLTSNNSDLYTGGHMQLFLKAKIAIPQLEGSTSAIAIPQLLNEILLCNSTIPQFRNRNFFCSPQRQVCNLRASLPQFSAYFWLWSSFKLYIYICLPPRVLCY